MSPKRQATMAAGLFVLLVVIDQIIKIYIKTHFYLRESVEVTSWFYLSFIENNGMAYGMEFVDKYVLTAFRIVLSCAFAWILFVSVKRRMVSFGYVVVSTMIIAGAVGNIIDCVFYGRWFTDSFGHVAQWADASAGLVPQGEWFKGRVVDMFYFPLVRFDWPDTFPVSGQPMEWLGLSFRWPDWLPTSNEPFMFFKPVFNFADACISVGVALLALFYRESFVEMMSLMESKPQQKASNAEEQTPKK